MRAGNLAVILPLMPASGVAGTDDDLVTGVGAHWQTTLRNLAEKALRMNAGFSLINPFNPGRVHPSQERFGTRPDHLLDLIAWLRAALASRGYTAEATARIGVCFDAGNAFRDPVVSKHHGLKAID